MLKKKVLNSKVLKPSSVEPVKQWPRGSSNVGDEDDPYVGDQDNPNVDDDDNLNVGDEYYPNVGHPACQPARRYGIRLPYKPVQSHGSSVGQVDQLIDKGEAAATIFDSLGISLESRCLPPTQCHALTPQPRGQKCLHILFFPNRI